MVSPVRQRRSNALSLPRLPARLQSNPKFHPADNPPRPVAKDCSVPRPLTHARFYLPSPGPHAAFRRTCPNWGRTAETPGWHADGHSAQAHTPTIRGPAQVVTAAVPAQTPIVIYGAEMRDLISCKV